MIQLPFQHPGRMRWQRIKFELEQTPALVQLVPQRPGAGEYARWQLEARNFTLDTDLQSAGPLQRNLFQILDKETVKIGSR